MTFRERWAALPVGVRLLVVALAYFASARIGLRLALIDDIVTPLWPPTGVAVVALTSLGLRVWPSILLAAFAVNVSIAETPWVAAIIALGNTLAPVAAAALLRRLDFDTHLARLRDAITLVGVALATMAISATIGTAAVEASGGTAPTIDTWWVWWAGDAMGVLLVAPVLWSVAHLHYRRPSARRVAEAVLLFAALAAVSFAAAQTTLLFVVLPLLGWIAWRFQQLGAAPAGLLASVAVIVAAANDKGIFAGESLLRQMELVQAFNASVALTSFVFAAAVTERRQVLQALYQREHRIAETLQRSFLPELPSLPGVAVAARYLPSSAEASVAGDWYDVFPLGADRLGLVVGDVVGHGLSAAAAMTQLRMGLRAYALAGEGPARTLEAVNRMALELHPGTMATLLYAEYEPIRAVVTIANAGHPPPLVLPAEGAGVYMEVTPAVPLGVSVDFDCHEAVHPLGVGDTLILFTDGLIERRHDSLDAGLHTLIGVVADAKRADGNVDAMCDSIIADLDAETATDDIALLVLRPMSLAGETLRLVRPAVPAAVGEVRRVLRRWLHANGATEDETYDVLVACSEAQTNAVVHAYHRPEGVVEVEATIVDRVVAVTVRDRGRRRRPFAEIGPDERGRGLPLIRSLMEVEVETRDEGTEVRMRRRLGTEVEA